MIYKRNTARSSTCIHMYVTNVKIEFFFSRDGGIFILSEGLQRPKGSLRASIKYICSWSAWNSVCSSVSRLCCWHSPDRKCEDMHLEFGRDIGSFCTQADQWAGQSTSPYCIWNWTQLFFCSLLASYKRKNGQIVHVYFTKNSYYLCSRIEKIGHAHTRWQVIRISFFHFFWDMLIHHKVNRR